MHFEINVTAHGKHFFATHARSAATESDARAIFDAIAARFPADEGFKITVTKYETSGVAVTFEAVAPVAPAPTSTPSVVVSAAAATPAPVVIEGEAVTPVGADDALMNALKASAAAQPKSTMTAEVKALYAAGIAAAKAAPKAAPKAAAKPVVKAAPKTTAIPGALVSPKNGSWTKDDVDAYYALGIAQAKAQA